jgi:putative phosphoesterase
MLIGVFADVHDHLDNLRLAVQRFNEAGCEVVLFAGDLVSTFAVPPLRKLQCPFVGCFGDNEGNKPGLLAGMSIIGTMAEPPVRYTAPDGTSFLLVHMERQARGVTDGFDVFICGHTHKPMVRRDEGGRLFLNPGETSGWTFRRPTIALLETSDRSVQIVELLSADLPAVALVPSTGEVVNPPPA